MSSPAPSPRLAVVVSHPIQYYSPWFRWLRANAPLEFRVFYLWKFGIETTRDPRFGASFKWDVDLLEGYDSEFVPNVSRKPGAESFWGFNNPNLSSRLDAFRPDAVLLFGYKWVSHLRTVAWARRRRIPLIFRGDSHLLGRGTPGWPAYPLIRALYAQFAAFLYVGAANRDYFAAFGVKEKKLFFAPHSVDDRLFHSSELARRAAAELRRQLGLSPSATVVLFAGKLVAEKQPGELLAAFLELRRPDASLVFVGDGTELVALREASAAAPPGVVHFLPFANQTEMPARYLLADLLALPSRGFYETWGLAVNEAMNLGVPALVSDRVGCQRDLVTEGETGWVFRTEDPINLREQLGKALDAIRLPGARERLRAATISRVSSYSYARTTDGLMAALGSLRLRNRVI